MMNIKGVSIERHQLDAEEMPGFLRGIGEWQMRRIGRSGGVEVMERRCVSWMHDGMKQYGYQARCRHEESGLITEVIIHALDWCVDAWAFQDPETGEDVRGISQRGPVGMIEGCDADTVREGVAWNRKYKQRVKRSR